MTLSSQIRALADRMKAHDAATWGYKATPDEAAAILAALELAERVEAPGTVEVVAQAIAPVMFEEFSPEKHGSPVNYSFAQAMHMRTAERALQALKGPTNAKA